MSLPLISILIPTYNRADWLGDALKTATEQETDGRFTFEVVVVDNDSPDNTRETIEGIAAHAAVPVKYIHSTRRGDAQARNAGLPHCEGDYLAFMDDDELAEPTWLKTLYDVAVSNDAQLVGGAVLLDLPRQEVVKLSLDVRRSLRERSPDTCLGETRPCDSREFPGTDNLFFTREVLTQLGEFDESCMSGTADYDFSVRAREAGFRCWFAPEAIVYHRTPANRLSQEFIDWESYRSGVMLAIYDEKYKSKLGLWKWLVLRTGQGVAVTLPKRIVATLTGDNHKSADARIRWKRLIGYFRGFLTLVAPRLFPLSELNERIHFLKGRQVGQVALKQAADKSSANSAKSSAPPQEVGV